MFTANRTKDSGTACFCSAFLFSPARVYETFFFHSQQHILLTLVVISSVRRPASRSSLRKEEDTSFASDAGIGEPRAYHPDVPAFYFPETCGTGDGLGVACFFFSPGKAFGSPGSLGREGGSWIEVPDTDIDAWTAHQDQIK